MERSLANACTTALQHGNSLSDIKVPHWALTFRCSEEAVRLAWERSQSELSLQPNNQYEEYGK